VTVALAGLAANQAIVYVMVEVIGWPYRLALVAVVVIVPGLSFLLIRHWAFSARD
jgi:putative flippase GtrA